MGQPTHVVQDINRHAQERMARIIDQALQLIDDPAHERLVMLSMATGIVGGTVLTLARKEMPHPLFKRLSRDQQVRLVLGIVRSSLLSAEEDQNELPTDQEISDILAAAREVCPQAGDLSCHLPQWDEG